jgi:flagellar assembly protein FliH
MNSPSEVAAKAVGAAPPAAVKSAARLEYRMLAEEELLVFEAGIGERRGMERRRQARPQPVGTGLSEEALQMALKAASAEGFQRGEREGRAKAKAELESGFAAELAAASARERERLTRAVQEFAESKRAYFAEIEGQVVRLALAIAARVLHRETQMDALVMAGAVHVVLGKLADRGGVILHAAVADAAAWRRLFAGMEDAPRVLDDGSLARGECRLETAMGMVELGVQTQLEEIENGFFDLLRANPSAPDKGMA